MGLGGGSAEFETGLKNTTSRTLSGLILPVHFGTQKSMAPLAGRPYKGKTVLLYLKIKGIGRHQKGKS